jgi:hypothetical protein
MAILETSNSNFEMNNSSSAESHTTPGSAKNSLCEMLVNWLLWWQSYMEVLIRTLEFLEFLVIDDIHSLQVSLVICKPHADVLCSV